MKRVKAEQQRIEYMTDCPYCGETAYSDFTDEWDVEENKHHDQVITCDECKEQFIVEIL